jgi:hypothetical protein
VYEETCLQVGLFLSHLNDVGLQKCYWGKCLNFSQLDDFGVSRRTLYEC